MRANSPRRHLGGAPLFKLLVLSLLLLLPLLLAGSIVAEAGPQPGATTSTRAPDRLVLRVHFRSLAERDRLAGQLDAVEAPTAEGYLMVVSDQAELASLRAQGLRVEIDEKQTTNINTPVKFGNGSDTFYGGYHTVEEMQAFMDQKVAAYPNLAEKVDIGDTWCKTHPNTCKNPNSWNGFDIFALHITNRNISGSKPVFWINSGIHAREIAPPEIALNYVNYLLDGYESNADAHWLVDYQDTWVLLPVNPDGHHIVESGGDNPVSWRKNADGDDGCTTFPYWGTDINRNFPFLWNCCGGSSSDPCAEAYHGTAAGSEEETQAIVTKIGQLIPDQRGPNITDPAPITTTGAFIDLHSFAGVNLYSWDMYNTPAPNGDDLKNLAFHMSSTTADPPGNDYTPCQFGSCLYIADGGSNDWVYGELGAAGFAMEIGDTFFPTYTETQTLLWPRQRGTLLYLNKVSRMPYLLTRGPDAALAATGPMTVTQGIPSQLTATINYAWDYHGGDNHYLQNVAAAEYYLDTPPWAGGTPVAMQPVDGQFDSPTEAVQATVPTGAIPVGRHILFVRGRGVNSYQGNQSWGPVSAVWLTVLPYASPTPTVTGTPPTATPTHTIVPTSTPTATPCTAPAIQNGGFETGSLAPDWVVLDNNPAPEIRTTHRHAGSYAAFLGNVPNTEPYGNSSMYQQFTVPASGGTLSFWYYPYSADRVNFDWQDAYITDVNGQILQTIMHVCEGTETWTNMTYDLAAYAGQTIRVEFLVHQDGAGDVTNMYVDDVMVISGPCPTPVATNTPTVTETPLPPTPCPIQFTDVPTENPFYSYIRCLACRGILGGYADGTFRPNNNITRGQIAKIVSNAANFQDDVTGRWTYHDVPADQTFWLWVERLSLHQVMGGYQCGIDPNELCDPQNRPYFRPANNATRGQLSKIVSNAAGYNDPPSGQVFTDVPPSHTFYEWIQRLATRGVMGGYQCGIDPNEPCDPQNRPYFRPGNNVTRGQASKIVANTFFPNCQTPSRARQTR